MIRLNFTLFLFIIFSFGAYSQKVDVEGLKNDVKKVKKDLRSDLGELRFDGTKSTYYEVKREDSYKDIEVILFLRNNYTVFFDGNAGTGKVTLRIFDKAPHHDDRILLYEVRNIVNKKTKITEKELNETLRMFDPDPPKLRSIHLEYEISKGRKPNRGAVVMMLGFDD